MKDSHPNDYMEYKVESEYKNAHDYISLYHITCHTHFKISPNSFISGRGCAKCGHERARLKNMKNLEDVEKELPDGISLAGPYNGMVFKSKVHCKTCGNTYDILIHDLVRRQQCPFCSGYNKETTETFKSYLNKNTHGEYQLSGDYYKANEYVTIIHNKCGNKYEVTPHNFKHGKRCPRCSVSIGEKTIEKVLKDKNVCFEPQKRFPGCKDKHLLSYDFYIPSLNILIEYQGEQHYHEIKAFGGKKKFDIQIRHDKIKREFANNNGIDLIEIPYSVSGYEQIKNYIDKRIDKY